MTPAAAPPCSDCDRGWRHCHHVWVVHRAAGECSGPEPCDEPAEVHELVVVCTDINGRCTCD